MARRVKSIRDELVKKARESMLAAVQIYNNPQITFKTETFITLSIISWTYLLHAYYRTKKIEYRYCKAVGEKKRFEKTKHGAYKHWELERCVNCDDCPLDSETTANLRFLIGIRHEIEHQMTNQIDELLSAKLQACALNFDYYITKLFGVKYSINRDLALAIQFSPISPEQQDSLQDNPHVLTNIRNFIVSFENELSEEALKSNRYAYRILFVPITANRRGQADQVIEFIRSDSPLAEGIEKTYAVLKETERKKYLPSGIVREMQARGYKKFNITEHTKLWQLMDAKDPKHGYGTQVEKTWYWYESWLRVVEEYCNKHRARFI